MKKILLLTIILTVLANCDISPRKANAQVKTTKDVFYNGRFNNYMYHEEIRHGMNYGIWSLNPYEGTSQTGYAVAVVNLTKDELEVELLKLQITELHNRIKE